MREIRTSSLMSRDGKRGFATAPVFDSTDPGEGASAMRWWTPTAVRAGCSLRRFRYPAVTQDSSMRNRFETDSNQQHFIISRIS
jgi:hypothetical protein